MEISTGDSRLIPEQVWDAADIPERELFRGQGFGIGMPAGLGSLGVHQAPPLAADGKIFDQPPQTVERYLEKKKSAEYFNWRFNNKPRTMPRGKKLRLLLMDPALVHWSLDDWQTGQDRESEDSGWNLQHVDLPTDTLASGRQIVFTFYWKNGGRWEGRDFAVTIE